MNIVVIVVLALMPFVFAVAAMIFGNRRPRRRYDDDLLTVR
ncbi:hypothetical protein WEH80_24080 [Actinomycetes bacterium KLBMP 9759]